MEHVEHVLLHLLPQRRPQLASLLLDREMHQIIADTSTASRITIS